MIEDEEKLFNKNLNNGFYITIENGDSSNNCVFSEQSIKNAILSLNPNSNANINAYDSIIENSIDSKSSTFESKDQFARNSSNTNFLSDDSWNYVNNQKSSQTSLDYNNNNSSNQTNDNHLNTTDDDGFNTNSSIVTEFFSSIPSDDTLSTSALTKKKSITEKIESAFGVDGIFKEVPNYSPRKGQIAMATNIACLLDNVYEDVNKLVVEAGTGIGKTFAYLVPIFLEQKKAVISTDSLALQDQLYYKDIETVKEKTGKKDVKVAKLKGLSNYICLKKLSKVFSNSCAKLVIETSKSEGVLKTDCTYKLAIPIKNLKAESEEQLMLSDSSSDKKEKEKEKIKYEFYTSYSSDLSSDAKESYDLKKEKANRAEQDLLASKSKSAQSLTSLIPPNAANSQLFKKELPKAENLNKSSLFDQKDESGAFSYRVLSAIVDYLNNDLYGEVAGLRKHFETLGEKFPITLEKAVSITRMDCQFAERNVDCKNCLAKLARNKAKNSDIIVMNHALFCNGAITPNDFFPSKVDICVFDECHKFPDRVREAFTYRLDKTSLQFTFSKINSEILKRCPQYCYVDFVQLLPLLGDFFLSEKIDEMIEYLKVSSYSMVVKLKELMNEFLNRETTILKINELLKDSSLEMNEDISGKINHDSDLYTVNKTYLDVLFLTYRSILNQAVENILKNAQALNLSIYDFISSHTLKAKNEFTLSVKIFNDSLGAQEKQKNNKSDKNSNFISERIKIVFQYWFDLLFKEVEVLYDAIDNLNTDDKFNYKPGLEKVFNITTSVDIGKSEQDFIDNIRGHDLFFPACSQFIMKFVDYINFVNLLTSTNLKNQPGEDINEGKVSPKVGYLDSLPLDSLKDIYQCCLLLFEEHFGIKSTFKSDKHYRWYNKYADNKKFDLNVSSYCPGDEFHEFVLNNTFFSNTKFVFASATIRTDTSLSSSFKFDAGGFESYITTLSLNHKKLIYALYHSPFDYQNNALLCIPSEISNDGMSVIDKIKVLSPAINKSKGGIFILCTSYAQLKSISEYITRAMENQTLNKRRLFVQGQDFSKNLMIEHFKKDGKAILIGTKSFWEGVDIAGDSLTLVIIDKIPFPGKSIEFSASNKYFTDILGFKSAFNVVSMPRALIDLKQGVGRLIRTERDSGVIILCAPSLLPNSRKNYKHTFWSAFSDFKMSFNLNDACEFFEE
jgi:Rad3-related DNA helicase